MRNRTNELIWIMKIVLGRTNRKFAGIMRVYIDML